MHKRHLVRQENLPAFLRRCEHRQQDFDRGLAPAAVGERPAAMHYGIIELVDDPVASVCLGADRYFPLVFVALFVSSAFFPRRLLSHPADWIAAYNPLSYVADGIRNPIISSVTASTVLAGLAAALGIAAVGTWASVAALRGRLRDA